MGHRNYCKDPLLHSWLTKIKFDRLLGSWEESLLSVAKGYRRERPPMPGAFIPSPKLLGVIGILDKNMGTFTLLSGLYRDNGKQNGSCCIIL